MIHPTAVVEKGAQLAEGVAVGPFCYVGPKVRLGAGTRLIGHATVVGRTTLGEGNIVWPYATLGSDPQDLKFRGEDSELVVGDRNEIRENATLHKGTANGGGVTRVGSDNLIMVGVHVAHDCKVGSHVILANNVQLAGHIVVEDHAAIAGVSAVHHFVTVGRYAYVAGMTRVVRDVPPFMVVEGNPARVRKVNTTLLERAHFGDEAIERLKRAFRLLYASHDSETRTVGRTAEAVEQLEDEFPDDPNVALLLDHVRRSSDGVYGRHRESLREDHSPTNPAK